MIGYRAASADFIVIVVVARGVESASTSMERSGCLSSNATYLAPKRELIPFICIAKDPV